MPEYEDSLLEQLLQLEEEDMKHRFPNKGCNMILKETSIGWEDFIPDLDLYMGDIAGYASWGKRILEWPAEKATRARTVLSKSFFEKHPEYEQLERLITEEVVPDLYSTMNRYEKMRQVILALLTQNQRVSENTVG